MTDRQLQRAADQRLTPPSSGVPDLLACEQLWFASMDPDGRRPRSAWCVAAVAVAALLDAQELGALNLEFCREHVLLRAGMKVHHPVLAAIRAWIADTSEKRGDVVTLTDAMAPVSEITQHLVPSHLSRMGLTRRRAFGLRRRTAWPFDPEIRRQIVLVLQRAVGHPEDDMSSETLRCLRASVICDVAAETLSARPFSDDDMDARTTALMHNDPVVEAFLNQVVFALTSWRVGPTAISGLGS